MATRSELQRIIYTLNQRLKGRSAEIELSISALLGQGHLLLEGPPGTGKTSLAKAIAEAFGGTFRRVQMTSDLLPSDIVGILRLKPGQSEFEFRKGPIFTHFLLADELNRTSPKTQSALLEGMAENTVTVDGTSHPLPTPFFVIATQNPLESRGVYPLAESQLDRFMLYLSLATPDKKDEIELFTQHARNTPNASESAVGAIGQGQIDIESTRRLILECTRVHVEESVIEYVTDLVRATRARSDVSHGVSTRGGIQLLSAAKALSFIRGRDYVTPQEIQDLTIPALAHRLCFPDGDREQGHRMEIIREIMERVKAPR